MARKLAFEFDGRTFDCAIDKVDRTKLYGSIAVETVDPDGRPCSLATLANDGKTLIPSGGTAFCYVNPDGEWISRKDLIAVDDDGDPLDSVPSSFDSPIVMAERVSPEEFLDHSIRLVYAIRSEVGIDPAFAAELAAGSIFMTPFSYRGGVDPDPAFILQGVDETVWMLIGNESKIEFVGLEQAAFSAAGPDADDDDGDESADDDGLDFGML